MCIYDYVHVYVYCVSVTESIVLYFFNKNIWGKKKTLCSLSAHCLDPLAGQNSFHAKSLSYSFCFNRSATAGLQDEC